MSKDDILLKILEINTNSEQSENESPHIYSIPNTSMLKENLGSQTNCGGRIGKGSLEMELINISAINCHDRM